MTKPPLSPSIGGLSQNLTIKPHLVKYPIMPSNLRITIANGNSDDTMAYYPLGYCNGIHHNANTQYGYISNGY